MCHDLEIEPPDCGLGAHEFPSRSVRRPALEAENKPNLQCVGQSLERFHARLVATALDTGDRRVAGADALSQLLLGKGRCGLAGVSMFRRSIWLSSATWRLASRPSMKSLTGSDPSNAR
jgi:hypothetical protein